MLLEQNLKAQQQLKDSKFLPSLEEVLQIVAGALKKATEPGSGKIEMQHLGQQRVKSRRGFRISLSPLFTVAFMEGIAEVREMNMENVEKWCRDHTI